MDFETGVGPLARLRRFLPDGAPDTSFASSSVYIMATVPESFVGVHVAVLGNDIFLGTSVDVASLPDADFYLEKVSSTGTRLASKVVDFALGGGHRDYLNDLAVASGRLVAVGMVEFWNNADYDYGIAVLDPATLAFDPTFSSDGRATVPFDLGGDNYDEPIAVTFDAGRILVTGMSEGSSGLWLASMTRLGADGSLDITFSDDGRASYAFTPAFGTSALRNEFWYVVVDPSGVIWVAALVRDPRFPGATLDAALVRILGNGLEDLS